MVIFLVAGKATVAGPAVDVKRSNAPDIVSAIPGQHLTVKVLFEDNKTADFKYIWVRSSLIAARALLNFISSQNLRI